MQQAKLFTRLLREPLVHFAILGGLIFVVMSKGEPAATAPQDHRIVISANEVERLSAAWAERWQRPPTTAELDGLIGEAVRERVLYQEALALGLDRDDVVIRRHLRQKFEFLTQDLAYGAKPDQAALRAYYDARPQRYAQPARISFSQIRFDPERAGLPAETAAAQALAALQGAGGPQAAATLGDATTLPASLESAEIHTACDHRRRLFDHATGHFGTPNHSLGIRDSYGTMGRHPFCRPDALLPDVLIEHARDLSNTLTDLGPRRTVLLIATVNVASSVARAELGLDGDYWVGRRGRPRLWRSCGPRPCP